MMPSCESVKTEVESVEHDLRRVDRLMTKLEDNNSKLTVLCTEMKALTEMQSRRMDNMDVDNQRHKMEINDEKSEFNRSVARIHDKIESSEEKNEKKIDYAVEKLSDKIDGLCEKSGQRIEKISTDNERRIEKLQEEVDKVNKYKWIMWGAMLMIGGLIAKFEILKNIIGN